MVMGRRTVPSRFRAGLVLLVLGAIAQPSGAQAQRTRGQRIVRAAGRLVRAAGDFVMGRDRNAGVGVRGGRDRRRTTGGAGIDGTRPSERPGPSLAFVGAGHWRTPNGLSVSRDSMRRVLSHLNDLEVSRPSRCVHTIAE